MVTDSVIASSVEIEGELSEAEGYLRAMDVEFRSISSAEKRSTQQKLTEYRDEYKDMLQKYQTAKFNAEAQALKGGPNARTKLLNSNQKLDSSTALLENSRQVLAQTERVGGTILTDLESQKEQLVTAKDHVTETRNFTSEARIVLRSMGTRAIMHKICVYATIIILAGVIGIIVYYGFVKK